MTDTLIINQGEVRRLLPMDKCIGLMRRALEALARGDAVQPLRSATWLPDRSGLLGLMPGFLGQPRVLGVKAVTVFPDNHGTIYESHQGAILLFDVEHGQLLAIIDGTEITAIRTAAVSGVATSLLARKGAGDLALLGSGVQARTHLEAMRLVRDLTRVRVWSRNPDHARRFAERESQRHSTSIEAVSSVEEAVDGAEIICTVTAAHKPVLKGQWIARGAHINAVGACIPSARELDTPAVLRSSVFVDRRESALHEAGDILIPKAQGALGDDHILAELGEVILGQMQGRTKADEITMFKSLGLATEDLAAAHFVYSSATDRQIGTAIPIGGQRHETS
ncbi:MAG: ornithine cyclodeaminase family protein [Planctomycetota bacterium]|nr:ornithine cyclodeaminase family protein [Planctomycetota bacterium]